MSEAHSDNKNNDRIYHYLFTGVVCAFIGLKFNDLFLPYFWDELAVYSRSSLYLAENGLSLLPSGLPPELSRGHPALFSFIYAIFYKMIGKEVWVGHAVSLAVSVSFLALIYHYVGKYSGAMMGACSVLLLVSQPVFFAQSTLVLPEITLALFVFLSLMFYYEQKILAFAIASSMAILVKESAIVIPFAVIAYGMIVQVMMKQRTGFFSPKAILCSIAPLLIFGAFLQIQKIQNGWYFFPLHIDSVSMDGERFLSFNKGFRDFLLYHQGRYWWVKVFIAAGALLLIRRQFKLKDHYTLLLLLFVLGFVIFSSMNFYMNRYMISALALLTVLLVWAVKSIYPKNWFVVPLVVLLSILSIRDMKPSGFHYDTDMSFLSHLEAEQKAAEYLCERVTEQDAVLANFPLNVALFEKNTGFDICEQLDFHAEFRPNTRYVAITSHSAEIPFPKERYRVAKYIEVSGVWAHIYEVIP